MRALMTKTLFILCIATVMVGCKIAVLTSSGGDVQSGSGTMNCSASSFCEFKVTSVPFAESFTAIPREGYEFEKWSDGSDFFCGKFTDPTCAVNIPDNAFGALLVALFDSGYVMPIFKDVGIDTDSDGVRNELDEDDDNDGVLDPEDDCPLEGPNVDGFGCPFLSKTVFVTSESYTGNLGGLAGADQKCNDLAAAASLAGDYKAWLSDSSQSPNTRFTQFPGPYKMVNGTVIASDFADVVDGALNTVIDRDEHGAPPSSFTSSPFVWTSTKPDGSGREDRHCVDWTNDVPGQAPGILGGGGIFADDFGTTASPIERWTYIGSTTCAIAAHLYCFQQ